MKPEFRFRLNGVYIPEIRVQRALVDGKPLGDLQIAVKLPEIGWFTIDDNENLPDEALPHFVMESRDETAWQQKDALQRRLDKRHGWRRVTVRGLLEILAGAGYISRAKGE